MDFGGVWKSGLIAVLSGVIAWAAAVPDLSLIDAVKRRDSKLFTKIMAQRGVDVNSAAPDGATALSWAVFLGLSDMADNLLAAGADVNTVGEYGESPLTLALANADSALAAKLLKAGADVKVARWNGETPLMIAAGSGNVEAVRLLLENGADVNGAEPKRGQTALMWAASEGHADVVDLLLEKGAKIDAVTKAGFNALVFAALKNDAPSVKRLLKAGANPNYALPDQTKILALSATNGSIDAALALLDGGADPNVADKTGNTPLHVAAQNGSIELVKKLLTKGANLNAQNAPAQLTGFRPVGGLQTPLLIAARSNNVDVMRVLIEAGADRTLKPQDGVSLFLAAAASGHVEAAKYAFEFDKDVKAVDSLGRTAMHQAVSNPRGATQDEMVELVQFLADIGVPLDEKDSRGRTPIQAGDGIPLDKPIQRMADIIVSRGQTPVAFPKEYVAATASPKK